MKIIKENVGTRSKKFADDVKQFFLDIVSWKLTVWEKIILTIFIIGRIPSEILSVMFGYLGAGLFATVFGLSMYSTIIFFTGLYYTESLVNKTLLKNKPLIKMFRNSYDDDHRFVKFVSKFGWPALTLISTIPFGGTLIASAAYSVTHVRYGIPAIILGDVIKISFCYFMGTRV